MSISIETASTEEPLIRISRVFDAPRQLVWEAFTTPAHVMQWFGGAGCNNTLCEMDLRPGGAWKHVMRIPDGSEYTLNAEFVEVQPPQRLVWRNAVDLLPGKPQVTQTITLEERGGKTVWTLVVRFASFAERDATVKLGFTYPISHGAERLAELLSSGRLGAARQARGTA